MAPFVVKCNKYRKTSDSEAGICFSVFVNEQMLLRSRILIKREESCMGQLIISIGREFGSGGHEIAEKLAKHYDMPLYDHNLLDKIAEERNLNSEELKSYDEVQDGVFHRRVRGMSSSMTEHVAQLQFDYLKEKANAGESFVVVGRCSETVLKDNKDLIAIFVNGDKDQKVARVSKKYELSESQAADLMKKKDRARKMYHNINCDSKWGDSRNYELVINSSKLGVDKSVQMLIQYIDARVANR